MMKRSVFDRFRKLVYYNCGISLDDGKEALITARVSKRMRSLGIDDQEVYLEFVDEDASGEELVQLLNVISTNVTSFFREPEHFNFLSQRLGEWLERCPRLRFWSAACATGEEPYSLAMTLAESVDNRFADIKILATDISTSALRSCETGFYSADCVAATIPATMINRYFDKAVSNGIHGYQIKSFLKKNVVVRRLNLAMPPFPMKGPFDVILCRNVMMYFDMKVRLRLVPEFIKLLRVGGYLIVGHTETLSVLSKNGLRVVQPSIYIRERP